MSVHNAFTSLGKSPVVEAAAEPLKPAVPIKKSVTNEFIISLEDGRKLKSMKRYLSGLGMTPADYRAKWGLPADYRW
jgi:predicted transcriptional regulator